MNKIISYPGNKKYFIKIFNELLSYQQDIKCLVDMFCGSSILYLNSDIKFEKVLLNDINHEIIKIFKSIQDIDKTSYFQIFEFINNEFGDILKNKESYYSYRNWFNKTVWNTNTIEEGVHLQILFNSCMSNLPRFSTNGFNQSFGNRSYKIQISDFELIQKMMKQCELSSKSFEDINLNQFEEKTLFFIDPPYLQTDNDLYDKIWNSEKLKILIGKMDQIHESGNYFIYTDVENELNKDMGSKFEYNYIDRNFFKVSPSTNKETRQTNHKEIFITNIVNPMKNLW